jgi:N utilization substance protein B
MPASGRRVSSRRTARKNAFLVLYGADVTGKPVGEMLDRWRTERGESLDEHAEGLVRGVGGEMGDLDRRLGESSVGWPVHRMSAVDRAILRLALYEMLHVEDVPAEVAISEAAELAKGFSSEEAPQFVGGVLRGARDRWLEEDRAGEGDDHEDGSPRERRVGHG